MMRNLLWRATLSQASVRPDLSRTRSASISLHIAFLVNNYPPHVGGVEQHVSSLASELIAIGHRVTVVTLGQPHGETIDDDIRVIRLPDRLRVGGVLSFPRAGTAARLALLLDQMEVDVISTHTRFFPMTVVGMAVGRRLGRPVVHTEHGSDFVRGVNPLVGLASRIVDLTVGRMALRRAAAVLAVSERVQEFVRRLSGVEARVLYNAIDIDVWRSAARAPRARVVFVGRIVPGKGWKELLSALASIRNAGGEPVETSIYGDGPSGAEMRTMISDLGLGASVTAHGQVDRQTLAAGVAGAILVNPTMLAEGFQTSLIEVIAAGGRVVTNDVAGAAILAADGAPVRIVAATQVALAAAIGAELSSPSAPYPSERLSAWGWRERAQEYVRVLAEVAAPRCD